MMNDSPTAPKRRRRRQRKGRQAWRATFGPDTMLVVGNLKVGKTSLFAQLIGQRPQVVRLPGESLELSYGAISAGRFSRLVDAPGFYSLQDRSEDAWLVRELLLRKRIGGLLVVLDAKNLRRGLMLVCQLAVFRVPMLIALNMTDEARQRGITIDRHRLEYMLGVPVISTVAVESLGVSQLKRGLADARASKWCPAYPNEIAPRADRIADLLSDYPVAANGLAYQLLAGRTQALNVMEDHVDTDTIAQIESILSDELAGQFGRGLDIQLTEHAHSQAEALFSQVASQVPAVRTLWTDRLAVWTRKPLTGIPIAMLLLALLYLFVGWFGAGVLVDLLEGRLFGAWILPWLSRVMEPIPWPWLKELLVGPFGLISVGLVLSLAIVLPVLATFFSAFALLEDSGYLTRLSLLLDRALRRIGLDGRGVLPLVMGLSCVTMAVLSTRVLGGNKQRNIATLLLVLAFPCAPLLSVMLVLLARISPWATVTLFGLIIVQFFVIGVLANALLPGKRQDFIMELPPLRMPRLGNILVKTGYRLLWFTREAIPYFLLGSLLLFALDQMGLLQGLREVVRPVLVKWLGLPAESADVFLLTIMRREAGAALLVQQADMGLYNGLQAMIALLVMTSMIPCINTALVMFKERGLAVGTAILTFVMVYSLMIGAAVYHAFLALGVTF